MPDPAVQNPEIYFPPFNPDAQDNSWYSVIIMLKKNFVDWVSTADSKAQTALLFSDFSFLAA